MKLVQHFAYEFGARIWRIIPANDQDILLVELRDDYNKEVSFLSIDIQSGDILAESFELDPGWWYGVECISNGVVIFHAYPDMKMPNHNSMFAFDISNGKQLWAKANYRYHKHQQNTVLAENTTNNISSGPEIFDLCTGIVKTTIDNIINLEIEKTQTAIPAIYSEANEYFKHIKSYLILCLKLPNLASVGQFEYLENAYFIAISWYQYSSHDSKLLDQYLLVSSLSGKILHNVKLAVNLAGLGQGVFFAIGSKLVYLQHNNSLYCFNAVHD